MQAVEADAATQFDTVTAALAATSDLSSSARLIALTDLGPALDGPGSYTIFVPVDDAWSALDGAELQALGTSDGRPQLVAVLRQHVTSGTVMPSDMDDFFAKSEEPLTLATMGAGPITLSRADDGIHVGEGNSGPKVIGAPILAGNDVIYRVDQLVPPPE